MRVAVFSDHFYYSKRQASLHWLVHGILANGHDVSFFSTPLSVFSLIKRDYRLPLLKERGAEKTPRLKRYEEFQILGPQRLRNDRVDRLYWSLALRSLTDSWVRKVTAGHAFDVVVIESGYSIGYYPELRRQFPSATFIYFACDDPRTIGLPTPYVEIDRRMSREVEAVYIASPGMAERYPDALITDNSPDISSYDVTTESPYAVGGRDVVSVGTMLFDEKAIVTAAQLMPDVTFHLIGPGQKLEAPGNVRYLGEMGFEKTLPYVKHADVGLAPYKDATGVGYIAVSSLKIKQYKYFGLPVVCPTFAALDEPGYFPYAASDGVSLANAIAEALSSSVRPRPVVFSSWKERAASVLRHEPVV